MGYAMVYGECVACHRLFAFNPHRVPSIRINGTKEPVCLSCVERANPLREANGLEPIVPHPDAYQPINESEL